MSRSSARGCSSRPGGAPKSWSGACWSMASRYIPTRAITSYAWRAGSCGPSATAAPATSRPPRAGYSSKRPCAGSAERKRCCRGAKPCAASEALPQSLLEIVLLVPTRIFVDHTDDLVAQLLIELWRLKAVRIQHHLPAPTAPRLLLGGLEQAAPIVLAAQLRPHPHKANLTAAAPSPAIDARANLAGVVARHDREQNV